MGNRNAAAVLAAVVFWAVLVAANVLVRVGFYGHHIPDPYSFAVVLLPPFPAAALAYALALRLRRRPLAG